MDPSDKQRKSVFFLEYFEDFFADFLAIFADDSAVGDLDIDLVGARAGSLAPAVALAEATDIAAFSAAEDKHQQLGSIGREVDAVPTVVG